MKKLLLIAAIGIGSLAAVPAKAQVSLSVNIGMQPDWGPRGYNHVDYYYLPDVDCYYDVPTRNYVYLDGRRWVHRRSLPARYRGYDLYGGRKIVINERNPWLRHSTYRTRYVSNYRRPVYRNYGRPTVVHREVYRGGNRHHDIRRSNYRPKAHYDRGGNRGKWNDRGGKHHGHGRGDHRGGDRGHRG